MENITFGLEINDFKYNQRRIAEVKYLGELYIYRMVDSPVIFDALYRLVTYGHDGGVPKPGSLNYLDLPDDYFRVRLVCTLLETCGMYYDKGQAKKKLDFFLTFFQYYLCTKDTLPMDVEFIVQDLYALTRPQWKLLTSLEEAHKAFADAVKANYNAPGADKAVEPDDIDESSSDDDRDDEDIADADIDDDKSSVEDAEDAGADEEPHQHNSDDEDEEHIIVTRQEDYRDPEADADFDRELAKLMAESVDSRKFERKAVFDVPLPIRRREAGLEEAGEIAPAPPVNQGTMKFSLLSKKGNRQQARRTFFYLYFEEWLTQFPSQTRSIDLPANSTFAVAMRNQQEADKAEQQRVKNLILNYDLRDDNESDGESTFHSLFQPNRNRSLLQPNRNRHNIYSSFTEQRQGLDKQHNLYSQARVDKAGNSRSTQRARKLQLSDVDWYDKRPSPSSSSSSSLSSNTSKVPASGIRRVVSSPTSPLNSSGA